MWTTIKAKEAAEEKSDELRRFPCSSHYRGGQGMN
jgi:hypothetical protein